MNKDLIIGLGAIILASVPLFFVLKSVLGVP